MNGRLPQPFRYKWVLPSLILILLAALVALWLWLTGDPQPQFQYLLDTAISVPGKMAQLHPILLILAIAVLPLAGMPVSVLFVIGGIAYGIMPACIYAMLGITLNNILGYMIAARWFHQPVAHLMARRGWQIPQLSRHDLFKVIIAFRLTPGFPLTVQNYLLGLAKVHFSTYLSASFVIQIIPVTGFVITGGSLFDGRWGLILLGLCLLLAAALMAKVIASR